MIARILRSADFERVLRTRTRVNSVHFAVHHLPDGPSTPMRPARSLSADELSTGSAQLPTPPVDDSVLSAPTPPPGAVWLGAVVPKRHARRSVTRSLLKRQIRAVVGAHAPTLAGGLWVVRLRAPFDRSQFVSAASERLRCAAHDELTQLIGSAARRATGR